MSVYLDASVLVAFLTDEPGGAAARRSVAVAAPGQSIISTWCDTEVSSALAKKVRVKALSAERENQARALWQTTMANLLTIVSVDTTDFHAAADLCARPDLRLRGPDALHLAVARRLGLGLATFDSVMAEAATTLAIPLVALD